MKGKKKVLVRKRIDDMDVYSPRGMNKREYLFIILSILYLVALIGVVVVHYL